MVPQRLFWKIFLPIGLMLSGSAIVAAAYLATMLRDSAEREAVAAARETAARFVKLRQYYTENVIAKVMANGKLVPSAEHRGNPHAVPLPATMILDLSNMLDASGTRIELYSPYPFPTRQGRVLDRFARDAWAFLQANPEQAFYRTETLGTQTVVRVGIADRMSAQACVDCHNSIAGSPKTDWKLGDVRGVLEITSSTQLDSGRMVLMRVLGLLALMLILVTLFLRYVYQRSVARPLSAALDVARALTAGNAQHVGAVEAIAGGDLAQTLPAPNMPHVDEQRISRDEIGQLLRAIVGMRDTQLHFDQALRRMSAALRRNHETNARSDWLKTGLNELDTLLRGEHDIAELAPRVLRYLVERVGAGAGALYLYEPNEQRLHLCAGYALAGKSAPRLQLALGEGLIGQALQQRRPIRLDNLPPDYLAQGGLRIGSALGQAAPASVTALPLVHAETPIGAIEIGSFGAFDEVQTEFLDRARSILAVELGVARARRRVDELLAQTQAQAEELRVQQEELQQSNEELAERAHLLEQQRELIEAKNRTVEAGNQELQRKTEELQRVSSYKSEFLANMSHELRTPLNSMLILSGLLQRNKDGQLTPQQVEYAATIHKSGKDLLNLISDILDLSKIEAGHLELHVEDVAPAALASELDSLFRPLAEQKKLAFSVEVAAEVPATIRTDGQRVLQVLRNLLANACKFTERGRVGLRIAPLPADAGKAEGLAVPALACEVSDEGIGIAGDKLEHIFQAFRQADGSTSRKYGGTGLGLSISRQLARLLGGDILVRSTPGGGSTFTLLLPLVAVAPEPTFDTAPAPPSPPSPPSPPVVAPTSASSASAPPLAVPSPAADKEAAFARSTVLLVDDDMRNIFSLSSVLADKGMSVLEATNGREALEQLAAHPEIDIVLMDIMMPEMDGYEAMRRMRQDSRHARLPIIALTAKAMLGDRQRCLDAGASDYIAKPVDIDRLLSLLRVWLYSGGIQ